MYKGYFSIYFMGYGIFGTPLYKPLFLLTPMESIFLNSFVLLEHLALLLTSTLTINC